MDISEILYLLEYVIYVMNPVQPVSMEIPALPVYVAISKHPMMLLFVKVLINF